MAEAPAFAVETVQLDLAPLAGALSRRLRDAGLPVTPVRAADFARALRLVKPVSRRRLYWTARAVFVSDPSHAAAFDAVFRSVFGDPSRDDALDLDDAELTPAPQDDRPRADHRTRGGEAEPEGLSSPAPRRGGEERDDDAEIEMPLTMASDEERLASKGFDALTPHELAQLHRLMSRLRLATPPRTTRRRVRGRRRRARRTGSPPVRRLARSVRRMSMRPPRRPRTRRRVVLGGVASRRRDISGSMEPYARAYLQFLSCAARTGPDAEAFAFATRLTRLTRALSSRRPDRAIQRAAAAAPDWSSGTRIGEALKTFNDRHGRRGMARGAVVVIISDGWERGDPELVGREMARLSRLAHRIVWVNPRVGATAFAVRAGGMVAALPHCDALVSGHSFAALDEGVPAIAGSWERPGALPAQADEPEPWASATPVPGSSVSMPSGHGPRRGDAPAGWVTDDD